MNRSIRLILALVLSLYFSPVESFQFTANWWSLTTVIGNLPGSSERSLTIGKTFLITSGSGYIDVVRTLDDAGTSTTTRMWVEEGISYGIKVSLDWVTTRSAEPGEACFHVTFGSPDFSSTSTFTYWSEVPPYQAHHICPSEVSISPAQVVDEFQLNASDGTFADRARITWNEIEGATGYQVFRCTTGADTSCGESLGSSDNNGFNDTGGEFKTVYYYRVKACTQDGCGDFSPSDPGYRGDGEGPELPEPPAQVNASDGTYNDKIEVTWSAVEDVHLYLIYISDTLKSRRTYLGQSVGFDSTLFNIKNLAPGTVHYIWVYSSTGNGWSETATYDTGYIAPNPDATVPEAPTLTSVTAGNGEAVLHFTVNSDGGAAIFGYTANCGAFSHAEAASPITVIGLTNGIEHSCSLVATNVLGESASSNVLSVTPMAPELMFMSGFEDD